MEAVTTHTVTRNFKAGVYDLTSGVVGRERMGTAFPHKKSSGNGVPTREILRFYCYLYFQMLPCYNIPCTSNHAMTGHQNLQSI